MTGILASNAFTQIPVRDRSLAIRPIGGGKRALAREETSVTLWTGQDQSMTAKEGPVLRMLLCSMFSIYCREENIEGQVSLHGPHRSPVIL